MLSMLTIIFVAIIVSFFGTKIHPVGNFDCDEPQEPVSTTVTFLLNFSFGNNLNIKKQMFHI